MTVKQLKKKARAMRNQIERCVERDQEWTSPQGNGVNACEAIEAADAFWALIEQLESRADNRGRVWDDTHGCG